MRHQFRAGLAALLAIIVAVGLAACGGSSDESTSSASEGSTSSGQEGTGASGEPIKVGIAWGKSGFMSGYDGPPVIAMKQAFKAINEEGGFDGREYELLEADTHSDVEGAKEAAEELVDRGSEILVATCNYDLGSPIGLVGEEAGLVTLSLCAQSSKWGVQGIGPLAYTPINSTYSEGAVLGQWTASKWKKAVILYDTVLDYNQEIQPSFVEYFEKGGGTVVGVEEVKNSDASISSQIDAIRNSGAEVLFFNSQPPGGPGFLRQIRAAGIDMPIVGTGANDGTYWIEAVPNLSDFFINATISVNGDDPNPEVNEWVEQYAKETGEPPATMFAVFGYVDAQLIAYAVEEAGSTEGAAMADVLNELDELKTIAGPMSYTPEVHISTELPQVILEYKNGKPEVIGTATPPSGVDQHLEG